MARYSNFEWPHHMLTWFYRSCNYNDLIICDALNCACPAPRISELFKKRVNLPSPQGNVCQPLYCLLMYAIRKKYKWFLHFKKWNCRRFQNINHIIAFSNRKAKLLDI